MCIKEGDRSESSSTVTVYSYRLLVNIIISDIFAVYLTVYLLYCLSVFHIQLFAL